MSDLYIVAVHLNTTGGGKRWYRSVPRSHSEVLAELRTRQLSLFEER